MAQETVIKASINASGAEKTLGELKKDLKAYNKELESASRGSEEYNKALKAVVETQKAMKTYSNDVRVASMNMLETMSNMTQTLSGVSGGFMAVQGAMALTSDNSEVLNATMGKMQSLFALTQGLSSLSSGLKSAQMAFSALWKGMLANPVGAIVAIIAGLVVTFGDVEDIVTALTEPFQDLWDSVQDLISPLNEMDGSLTRVKASISAVATAISKLVAGGIKGLIKLIQGDFDGAMEEFKNGFDVAGNFAEGFDKAMDRIVAKDNAKKLKAQGEEMAKMYKDQIEYNEAKYGSDFKYTEDGIALYRAYYANLKSMYDTDSEEYRKAENERLAFEREINNQMLAEEEARRKAEEEARLAEEAEELARQQKELQDLESFEQAKAETRAIYQAEYVKSLQEAEDLNPYREYLQSELDAAIEAKEMYQAMMEDETLTLEERIEAQERFNESLRAEISTREELNKTEDKINAQTLASEQALANAKADIKQKEVDTTLDVLDATASAFGEETVAGKASAIASTTISTYQSAQEAFSSMAGIPVVGPALGIAAMAAAIANGVANVRQILTVDAGDGDTTSASSISATTAMEAMPSLDTPIAETYSTVAGVDEETLNAISQPVLVVEDVNDAQRRVSTAESASKF